MEKPVNKLNHKLVSTNTMKTILSILFLGSIFTLQAQERLPFNDSKKYFLADVEVNGKLSFNKQTVVTFAGLEKGQAIVIPGEEISNAIKKLGKLGLFSDIDFYLKEVKGDSVYIELNINELPKLSEVKINGLKKGKVEDILKEIELTKGKIVNENLITTTKNYLENKYKKDGFYNTKVAINTLNDTTEINHVKMVVLVDKGEKIKITKIDFEGNQKFSDKKLRKAMKNTKVINPIRILKASKYIKDKYKEDLNSVVGKYKEKGFRDARVVADSVWIDKSKNKIAINVKVEEGNKYYFGNIKFLGNTVYSDQYLNQILGISKGDVYNGVLLEKRVSDKSKPDGNDISNLYQNNGYLFSSVNPVEVKTTDEAIDFEIRINEGPLAYFNKVTVSGNDKTNDAVIYREIKTKPGRKWSKEEVIRTIRELGQLGFFEAETIQPEVKNADPVAGTVDVNWPLVERGSSQIELQGGYGGGGFIGTLGLSFNNFSVRNLFNKEAYRPLPMGDGQKVSLRAQAATFFQTYSLSFSEPWFGGKKPVSFSASLSHSKQFLFTGGTQVDRDKSFNITTLSIGVAKRLTVPDDFFVLSNAVSFQYYDLNNYFDNNQLFTFGNGASRNLAFTVGLTRNSKGDNPIYPTKGSEFSVVAKFTPPYSLFNDIDYSDLGNQLEYKLRYAGVSGFDTDGNLVNPGDLVQNITNANGAIIGIKKIEEANFRDASVDQSKVDQERFNWLEYYKLKFKADWFTRIAGTPQKALVVRALGEFGFLGAYNNDRGLVPFERFFVGGDGLANFALDGREIIQLRGYENNSLSPDGGGTIYNKFSLELRYPITLKGSTSIYTLGFLEAGSSFSDFKRFDPFQIQRSAGLGLRVFMPAFGLLGIDFGHGFDPAPGQVQKSGWQTHFIIGQQF